MKFLSALTFLFAPLSASSQAAVWQRRTDDLSPDRGITKVQSTHFNQANNELFIFMYGGPASIIVVDADTGESKRNLTITQAGDFDWGYGIRYASVFESPTTGAVVHIIVMVNDDTSQSYNGHGRMLRINDDSNVLAESWSIPLSTSSGGGDTRIPATGGPIQSVDGSTVYTNLLFGNMAAYTTSNGSRLWLVEPMQNQTNVKVGGLSLYGDQRLIAGKTEDSSGPGPHGASPQFFMFDTSTGATVDSYTYDCPATETCIGDTPEAPQIDPSGSYAIFNDGHLGNVRFNLANPMSNGPFYTSNSQYFIGVAVAVSPDSSSFYGGRVSPMFTHVKYVASSGTKAWGQQGPTIIDSELVNDVLLSSDRVYYVHRNDAIGRNFDGIEEIVWDDLYSTFTSATLNGDGSLIFLSHSTTNGVVAYSTELTVSPSESPTAMPVEVTPAPVVTTLAPTMAPSTPVVTTLAPTMAPATMRPSAAASFSLGGGVIMMATFALAFIMAVV